MMTNHVQRVAGFIGRKAVKLRLCTPDGGGILYIERKWSLLSFLMKQRVFSAFDVFRNMTWFSLSGNPVLFGMSFND